MVVKQLFYRDNQQNTPLINLGFDTKLNLKDPNRFLQPKSKPIEDLNPLPYIILPQSHLVKDSKSNKEKQIFIVLDGFCTSREQLEALTVTCFFLS